MQTLQVTIITDAVDGEPREYAVITDNRDRVRWEIARAREKWPDGVAAPTLLSTYLAWAALARSGELDGMKFETFQTHVYGTEAALVDVDPTQAVTGAASSSNSP